MKSSAKARQLAALIMQVRTGQISATAAAQQLGISRKTYYQWERRALQGMMEGLEDRPTGRPSQQPDPETEQLQQKIQDLEKKLNSSQEIIEIREKLEEARRQSAKKKPRPSRKSSR